MTAIRVLLVDDAAEFLASARAFMSRLSNIEIVGIAMSGDAGLELAQQLEPDLVLMDLVMPGMNGLAATSLLKALPRPPRVVIVTLHNDPEYRLAAESARADGFVAKSDFATALPVVIDTLFAGSRSTDSAGLLS